MLKWFERKSNETKVSVNVDMSQDEINKVALAIEEQNSEPEPKEVELTPELCRQIVHRTNNKEKDKLIKIIKNRIKYSAECGDNKSVIILAKTEKRLSYGYSALDLSDRASIHKDDIDEIINIFKNKGFNVITKNDRSILNGEELVLTISWKE